MSELNFFDAPRALDWNQTAIGSARFTLSESPSGAPIYVPSGSVGNATLVHTFPVNTNAIEEVYLYVSNKSKWFSTQQKKYMNSLFWGHWDI